MVSKLNLYTRYKTLINASLIAGLLAWLSSNVLDKPILFSFVYTIFFLLLGILNLYFVFSYRKSKSNWFYGVLLFGISMSCWAIGEFLWFYFAHILKLSSFYPSIADIFYSLIYPLMFFALIYFAMNLRKASVVSLNNYKKRTLVAFILIVIGYFLVLYNKTIPFFSIQENLQSFFDITYLLWDALLIIGSIIIFGYLLLFHSTSQELIGTLIVSSLGMLLLFVADVIFSYSMGTGLYIHGNYIDLLYMLSAYLISLGVISFLNELHISA